MLRIISGAQTGVDQVALEVAYILSYPTGGMMPKGWKTHAGPRPDLARRYGLTESPFLNYAHRTIQNVLAADLTVWFGYQFSPGGKLTLTTARQRKKPLLVNPDGPTLRLMLTGQVAVMNVAGNRIETHPSSAVLARDVLEFALAR